MSCNKPTTNDFGIREEKKNNPEISQISNVMALSLGEVSHVMSRDLYSQPVGREASRVSPMMPVLHGHSSS